MGLVMKSLLGICPETMPGFAVTDEEESYSPRGDMLRINQDINRDMTVPEVMASLTDHGCEDITSSLNLEKCDQLPTEIRSSGDLYRGVLGDGREIAIKCIQPTFTLNNENSNIIKSAAHELYIWSKLSHPNVVQLMGLADYHMRLAMISPWVENSDLSRYLYTHRPPQEERLKMGAQIADGLAYLHGVGMVHGDLKAANISISANSTAVITGFGNSIIKEHSVEFTNSTKGVNISIRWTAPELLMGQGIPSQMADVWALGMVILEILTGSVPYAGLHDMAVWAKIMKHSLPARPEKYMPTGDKQADSLWSLLNECWATNPVDRPTATGVRDTMNFI